MNFLNIHILCDMKFDRHGISCLENKFKINILQPTVSFMALWEYRRVRACVKEQ